jgi:6-phosphogluconolactonase
MAGVLHVSEDGAALARDVADWLLERALKAERFAVGLCGGSSPKGLFELLATPAYRDRFPWDRTHWFWGDERFVPPDDKDSNYRLAHETFLSHVPAPKDNIHPVPTVGISPDEAARAYERTLRDYHGSNVLDAQHMLLDVSLQGIGEDGHTASLIPGQPVLNERTRWVAPVPHGRPDVRITMTYPALEASRAVAFLLTGAGKRDILRTVQSGSSDVPAARLHPLGELLFFADRAAAGQ